MLVELRAENYAVIDHAIAALGPGLNLLTGETGAGKSILVDALALLMGGKASADVVRHGAEKAVVACVFESTPGAEAILEENGIDVENGTGAEGGEIILRREILASGKGRVFVNNQPATVAVLRQLAPELALVHAQTETLVSFDQAQQRILLDRFGGISTDALAEAYARWRAAREKLDELLTGEQDRLRMVDLWSYQRKEIETAHLEESEDEKLETEKRVLANAEKLYAAAMGAFEQLYEGGTSAEAALRAALRNVEELARYDGRFAEAAQQLSAARATVGDVSATLRDYAEGIDASPERLAEIEDRLAVLDRLKRKYGKSVAEVIAFGEDVERRLAEVEDRDGMLKQLRAELEQAESAYRKAASALSAERRAAATKLEKLAEAEINSLAMKVKFAIDVAPAVAESSEDKRGLVSGHDFSHAESAAQKKGALAPAGESGHTTWTAHGWDAIEFRIATNAGDPLKPLTEIASGGEMSRVMLALKVAVEESVSKSMKSGAMKGGPMQGGPVKGSPTKARSGNGASKKIAPRTLVFDEIDIGIGGRAAEAVGQKLKSLARGQQVLCVTHLPQIAAFADQHLAVEKRESQGRAKTQIRVLDDAARTREVARMLSGAKVTETSLQHAAQMIAGSR